jgi:Fe-S-cluster-containing hydrogenase component 2
MSKRIVVHPENCTGCRLCELACSFEKSGAFSAAYSRIKVAAFDESASFIPLVCTQCDGAWCFKICPIAAVVRDPESKVFRIDNEHCVGCRMCVMACPFGSATYDAEHGKAIKCDECGGNPRCVSVCPNGALTYEGEAAGPLSKRIKVANQLLAAANKDNLRAASGNVETAK